MAEDDQTQSNDIHRLDMILRFWARNYFPSFSQGFHLYSPPRAFINDKIKATLVLSELLFKLFSPLLKQNHQIRG